MPFSCFFVDGVWDRGLGQGCVSEILQNICHPTGHGAEGASGGPHEAQVP